MAVVIFSAQAWVVAESINTAVRIHRHMMEELLIVDGLIFLIVPIFVYSPYFALWEFSR